MEEAAQDPQTRPAMPEPNLRGREDRSAVEELNAGQAVAALGREKPVTETEAQSALDWFLSDAPEDLGEAVKTIEINVGSSDRERWISWTIRAVDIDELRRIQRLASGRARRGKEGDSEIEGNLRVIVEGTADPDLYAAAKMRGIADPATALRMRFKNKPGLLGQIAGEIMALSGFDGDDVREAQAGKD